MKILIFTEGTILMHHTGIGKTPAERVEQSRLEQAAISAYHRYIPIGDAVTKIEYWIAQGAEIYYLTSRTELAEVMAIKHQLKTYAFPNYANLLYRHQGQVYADVAEQLMPAILIEDDCASIGGVGEMVYPHLQPTAKGKIISITVPEFSGIDHLPPTIVQLARYAN